MTKILKIIKNFFYTPQCIFCDKVMEINSLESFCRDCVSKVKFCRAGLRCEKCGKSIESHGKRELCYFCLQGGSRYFDKISSVFEYDGLVRESILRYKSHNLQNYAKPYARFLLGEFSKEYGDISFDFICAAPSHTNKGIIQGFDNVEIICKQFSKLTEIPFVRNVIKKKRKTARQSGLVFEERLKNLHYTMEVKNPDGVKDKIVLLIDDICTTRATIIECSRALKSAGAKQVYALTLATTQNKT